MIRYHNPIIIWQCESPLHPGHQIDFHIFFHIFFHIDCSCSKGINKETNIVFSETYLRKTNSWCKCKQTSVKKVTKSETSIISLFIPLSSPAGILTLQDHFSDYAIFSLHCNILLDIEIAGLFFNFKFCQIEDLLTYWQKPL